MEERPEWGVSTCAGDEKDFLVVWSAASVAEVLMGPELARQQLVAVSVGPSNEHGLEFQQVSLVVVWRLVAIQKMHELVELASPGVGAVAALGWDVERLRRASAREQELAVQVAVSEVQRLEPGQVRGAVVTARESVPAQRLAPLPGRASRLVQIGEPAVVLEKVDLVLLLPTREQQRK